MNLVITGSRDWPEDNTEIIDLVVDRLFWGKDDEEPYRCYVGDARGVDKVVRDRLEWVNKARVPTSLHVFKADWDKYGKAAGPIRNREMLKAAGSGLLVAFHTSPKHFARQSGTNGCAGLAESMGFQVYHIIGGFE
jgi:hypothetical protein